MLQPRGKGCKKSPLLPLSGVLLLVAAIVAVSGRAVVQPKGPSGPAVKGKIEFIGRGEDKVAVLYLWGSPYEIGYAHGRLVRKAIRDFYRKVISAMCAGMKISPSVLDRAYAEMEPFIPEEFKQEMKGLAAGAGVPLRDVHRAHAIPDLSELDCTFFAAWGGATKDGHLYQIRALDYATEAHIQDHPAIILCLPEGRNPVAIIGWTGFIGAVSGISAERIAFSEIGDDFGAPNHQTLKGEPFPFIARRALETAKSLEEAVSIFRRARRTSSYLYCLGDAEEMRAVALATAMDIFKVFGPRTLPFEGHLDSVVYASMGLDSNWNGKVFGYLRERYGKIDEKVCMGLMRDLGTGDLHAVVYDVTDLEIWVANAGRDGTPAFKREFVYLGLRAAFDRLRALASAGRR